MPQAGGRSSHFTSLSRSPTFVLAEARKSFILRWLSDGVEATHRRCSHEQRPFLRRPLLSDRGDNGEALYRDRVAILRVCRTVAMSLPVGAFMGDENNVCFVTCLTKRPFQPPLIPPCMSQRGLPRWLKTTNRGPSPWTGPEHGRRAAHADAYFVRASLREKHRAQSVHQHQKEISPDSLGAPDRQDCLVPLLGPVSTAQASARPAEPIRRVLRHSVCGPEARHVSGVSCSFWT